MPSKFLGLNLGDFERGLIVAVLSAILTVVYDSLSKGLPTDLASMKPMLLSAAGVGLTAGIAYILKNLGTNSEGKILKSESK